MKTITCDVCGGEVNHNEVRVIHIYKDLCLPCEDKLKDALIKEVDAIKKTHA